MPHLPIGGTRRDGTRLPVPDRTDAAERAALVRHIAADPVRVQWLRDHVADALDRLAAAVRESDPPTVDVAAAAIERRAGAHRRGETPLW
jgi:hypothetical protein